jgi:L-asparaginase
MALQMPAADWPWVEVLFSHAGADARLVHALVAAGVKGLVVAGTGNGTVHHSLLKALAQAQDQGVVVRLTTRCAEGQIVGQSALQMAPKGLNAYKARVSLMLDLMGQV